MNESKSIIPILAVCAALAEFDAFSEGKSSRGGGSVRGVLTPMKPRQRGPGRNGPCPCGSGKKSKRCCGYVEMIRGERRSSDE